MVNAASEPEFGWGRRRMEPSSRTSSTGAVVTVGPPPPVGGCVVLVGTLDVVVGPGGVGAG